MKRRHLIATIAGASGIGLAGCNTGSIGSQNQSQSTTTETGECMEWTPAAGSGFLIDVLDITDEKLVIEGTLPFNDHDYTVTLHETLFSEDSSAELLMRSPVPDDYYGQFPDMLRSESHASTGNVENPTEPLSHNGITGGGLSRLVPVVTEPGEEIGNPITVRGWKPDMCPPVDATPDEHVSWSLEYDEYSLPPERYRQVSPDVVHHRNTSPTPEHGGPILEFDLNRPPVYDEPFVITFMGEFDKYEDPIWLCQTPQIIRRENGNTYYPEYVRVRENSRPKAAYPKPPKWFEIDNNTSGSVDATEKIGPSKYRATRLGSLSKYSVHMRELIKDSFGEWGHQPTDFFLFGPRARGGFMFSIEYEVESSDRRYAEEAASKRYEETGGYRTVDSTSNAIREMYALSQSEEYLNVPAVQRVAKTLRNECDAIGLKDASDRVRLVVDFVVGLEYNIGTFSSGVGHPPHVLEARSGDCSDLTMLAYAILSQDEFDVNPELAFIDDAASATQAWFDGQVGHVGLGIAFRDIPHRTQPTTNPKLMKGPNGNYFFAECTKRDEFASALNPASSEPYIFY